MGQSSVLVKSGSKSVHSTPVFDGIFSTVLSFPSDHRDIEKITWVNKHSSVSKVSVKFANGRVYMAFENDADALIFKIRYLL